MSFQPVAPLPGIAGWRFVERTEAKQREAFGKDAQIQRETAYFREKIASITTAEDLVKDRTLLKVALGAFGLEGELDKKAFIRKVLAEGTEQDGAFALRLTDRRYRNMAYAFGFGNSGGATTGGPGFADAIIAQYKERAFETAMGQSSESMRLALNYRRAIAEVTQSSSKTANWFSIIGDKPVRTVMEKALGIPAAAAKIDVDKQAELFADAAAKRLGISDPKKLRDPEVIDGVIRRFLAVDQAEQGPTTLTPGYAALTLLGSSARSSGLANLIFSR